MGMKTQWSKTQGMQQNNSEREVYSNTLPCYCLQQSYLKKQEKYQINNLTLHLKQLEKEKTKLKVSRRKEITKIRTETSEIETKKQQERAMK